MKSKSSKQSSTHSCPVSRVLKQATCLTLSGKSELTYQAGIGANAEIYLRVTANSGKGQFNSDWVPLEAIQKQLGRHPADKPITSRLLHTFFHGKSSNSPAFLFAVLKAERFVKLGEEKERGYVTDDPSAFHAEISALIAAGADLAAAQDSPPQVTQKKGRPKASATTSENA